MRVFGQGSAVLAPLAILMLAVASLACSSGDSPVTADAEIADAVPIVLPACAEAGVLYTRNNDAEDSVLTASAEVGVVRGFQGFVFSRVGLRSPHPMPKRATVRSHAVVDQTDQDVVAQYKNVFAFDDPAVGWHTEPVWIFFNDATLTDLIGHQATLTLRADTDTCTLTGAATVALVPGGFMGREGFEEYETGGTPNP